MPPFSFVRKDTGRAPAVQKPMKKKKKGAGREAAAKPRMITFDIETTGTNASEDNIIEIAAVDIESGKTFRRLIRLDLLGTKNQEAYKRVGLDKDLRSGDGCLFPVAAEEFRKFCGSKAILIAHGPVDVNAIVTEQTEQGNTASNSKDVTWCRSAHKRFLDIELKKHALHPMRNTVIETFQLAKKLVPQFDMPWLDLLQKHFKIPIEPDRQGGSLAKAEVLQEVFMQFQKMQSEENEHLFTPREDDEYKYG